MSPGRRTGRARRVSAAVFALAGVAAAALALAALAVAGGVAEVPWWSPVAYLLAYAVPAAGAGAVVGPHLARSRTAGRAVALGAAAAVGAAVLVAALAAIAGVGVGLATEARGVGRIGTSLARGALAGLLLSPVGMLAGWLSWRRLRRGRSQPEPTDP